MDKMELSFVCEELELEEELVLSWVQCQLIQPIDIEGPYFDEEDLGRIRLIADMKRTFNTSDETLEVILHLVDQVHALRAELKKISKT
jgi:chaperone modulatory protein CbpM